MLKIDTSRLWQRHMEMGEIGATPKGGVNRQAFSAEDAAARRLLCQWARARDFHISRDSIGNLFIRRAGTDDARAPVMTGSHLDSQPTGGKFDGAFGVLAGLEALEAIEEAGIETKAPIELVAWSNEEGGRFQPGAMGSAFFVGEFTLAQITATTDRGGNRLGDALTNTLTNSPQVPMRFPQTPAAYIEAHIEQGPILEAKNLPIGVVTDIQGIRHFTVEVTGNEAHAGTTPRASRRDALMAAVDMIAALDTFLSDEDDIVRFTVGRMEVAPGSPNTIPGHALFTIDLRHRDAATLNQLGDEVAGICEAHLRGCKVAISETLTIAPTRFDETIVDTIRRSARALEIETIDMISGAGHDAMFLAKICPAAMIFVPCEGGISHNEAENAKPEDLAAGTQVLAHMLCTLADR